MPVVVVNTPLRAVEVKQPGFFTKWTKNITGIAAIVIGISMIVAAVSIFVGNDQDYQEQHGVITADILAKQQGTELSEEAQPGGSGAVGVGGSTGTNAPQVTLKSDKASYNIGDNIKLSWSVKNKTDTCEASEDWSGSKPSKGTETVGPFSEAKLYIFILTCKTSTDTGYSKLAINITAPAVSVSPGVPAVSISASPSLVYVGNSSTVAWSATNNPTSCTASGDWSGARSTSSPSSASTGKLTKIKTYEFIITCKNAAGTSSPAKIQVKVEALPEGVPGLILSSNKTSPVVPGTSIKITWTTTNNPSSCTASGDWTGSKSASGGSYTSSALNSIKTYSFKLTCSNSKGSIDDTILMQVLPNAPFVSLTVSPTSINTGESASITWSATNSPTSCSATSTSGGGWSGTKSASGASSTGIIYVTGTYYYNLSCTNAGGTGYANNIPLTVNLPPKPGVSLSASPIAITAGSSSTLTWSVTNSPTSCTASGDWSGSKSTSGGSQSTGVLNTVQTYTYTLTCTNAGGSTSAQTSVTVSSGGGGTSPPAVSISVSPSTIGNGDSSTINWSASNSPTSCTASGSWSGSKSASGSQGTGTISTAGSYTYTLTCSNSAGSDTKSATLTVIAKPVVTISASPTTFNTGSNTSLTWNVTNSPTSCTAGGQWSGSKGSSGTNVAQTAISTAGTYIYSLTCTNAGGTGYGEVSVTVNAAAAYCGGNTPCYGHSDLAMHNTRTDCWGYNQYSSTNYAAYNITNFNTGYHKPSKGTDLLPSSGSSVPFICGDKNFASFLAGTSLSGVGSQNHQSTTKQNNNSAMNSYKINYFDINKP